MAEVSLKNSIKVLIKIDTQFPFIIKLDFLNINNNDLPKVNLLLLILPKMDSSTLLHNIDFKKKGKNITNVTSTPL